MAAPDHQLVKSVVPQHPETLSKTVSCVLLSKNSMIIVNRWSVFKVVVAKTAKYKSRNVKPEMI